MIDNKLEEGFSEISRRRPEINSGGKPQYHSHSALLARLMENVEKENDCWIWKGAIDEYGYGMIQFKHRAVRTHRIAFRIHVGRPLPTTLCVLHTCDTPRCVNPNHLVLGTKKDNSDDCVNKGRTARGSQIGTSRLTEKQARQIVDANLGKRDLRITEFAKRFGVARKTIYAVRDGIQWKYLSRPKSP